MVKYLSRDTQNILLGLQIFKIFIEKIKTYFAETMPYVTFYDVMVTLAGNKCNCSVLVVRLALYKSGNY